MARLVGITKAGLRRNMRDPRYWTGTHPERDGFVGWVTEGWQELGRSPGGLGDGGGIVFVSAYERSRGAKPHHVSAHLRGAGRSARPDAGGASLPVTPVQFMPFLLTPKPPMIIPRVPRAPAAPEGTPQMMQRVPRQSGKEAASDVPQWARGQGRERGDSATKYAEKLLDQKYGDRHIWDTGKQARGPKSEFSRIKKFGERAFREDIGEIGEDSVY